MSTSLKEMGETAKALVKLKAVIIIIIFVFDMKSNFLLMNFGRAVCKVFQ